MSKTPTELLNFLASYHPPEVFHTILAKDVFPLLDTLPKTKKEKLIKILTDLAAKAGHVDSQNSGTGLIAYDEVTQSISKGIKELLKDVKNNWKHGYEEQGEMMGEIAGEMQEWLPNLWLVGVDKGVEQSLVHKSLKFIKASHEKVSDSNSRSEYSDMDLGELIIADSNGKVVYLDPHGGIEAGMLFVWRDLLLSSIVHSPNDTLAKKLVAEIESLGLSSEMLKRLDDEIMPPPTDRPKYEYGTPEYKARDWHLEERQDLLMNAHFTPEMRAAIPKVVNLLTGSQLAQFERTPDFSTFSTIVSVAPTLREKLLESTRSRVFPPKTVYTDLAFALRIFQGANADEDLIRLLDTAQARPASHRPDAEAVRDIVTYLMKRPDPIRAQALKYLKQGLMAMETEVRDAIEHAFPTLDVAWKWLHAQVRAKRLASREPGNVEEHPSKRTKYEPYVSKKNGVEPHVLDPKRDPVFKVFCENAGWTPASYDSDVDEDSEDDDDMGNYDSDDYPVEQYKESREEREDISTYLIMSVQKWSILLDSWPVAAERDALKKSMRDIGGADGRLFYDVDGAADTLARRCDYGNSKPCRQKLGRAIRQLYYAFAVDSPHKDKMHKSMPSNLSFIMVN